MFENIESFKKKTRNIYENIDYIPSFDLSNIYNIVST